MAYIKKTATGYQAQIELQGIRRSKTFATKREATLWAAKEETAIREQSLILPSSRFTLKQTFEKYRDEITPRNTGARWERIRIDAFLSHPEWLPLDKKIGQVSTDDFGKFRDERLKTVKPGTVLREFGILSAIMEVARKEWKWISANPIRDVKKPQEPAGRSRLITRAEIKSMLRGLDYHPRGRVTTITNSIAVCFLLALRTGMRAGDMTSLEWKNVKARYVTIEIDKVGRKRGVGRDVPLSKKAVRIIDKMKGFDADSVFALKPQTLDARFRTIRDRLGLSGFTFHDSRHLAATWIAMSGKLSIMQMTSMFGWTDPKMAMRYFNPKPEDIAARLD